VGHHHHHDDEQMEDELLDMEFDHLNAHRRRRSGGHFTDFSLLNVPSPQAPITDEDGEDFFALRSAAANDTIFESLEAEDDQLEEDDSSNHNNDYMEEKPKDEDADAIENEFVAM